MAPYLCVNCDWDKHYLMFIIKWRIRLESQFYYFNISKCKMKNIRESTSLISDTFKTYIFFILTAKQKTWLKLTLQIKMFIFPHISVVYIRFFIFLSFENSLIKYRKFKIQMVDTEVDIVTLFHPDYYLKKQKDIYSLSKLIVILFNVYCRWCLFCLFVFKWKIMKILQINSNMSRTVFQ